MWEIAHSKVKCRLALLQTNSTIASGANKRIGPEPPDGIIPIDSFWCHLAILYAKHIDVSIG